MSEFKVGDKVYLECEVKTKDMSDNTYELKYKNWHNFECSTDFVTDDVLHPVDELYNKGLNDAWELAKKIALPSHMGGYTANELVEIFGKYIYKSVLYTFTPQEALAKVKEYEERNEIRVGDVVRRKGTTHEAIVTRVTGTNICFLFRDGSADSYATKEELEKTGHFDSIDEFMKQED
jgi:hypothetical protein